jgi:hypothetical protein
MGINDLMQPLEAVQSGVSNITPTTAAVIAGGAGLVIGAGAGAGLVAVATRKKTKKRKRKTTNKNKRTRKKKYNSSRRRKHTKRTSHKKIRYTKNHQPYIILASGKARFIKKTSAKRSKKMKGGYY